MSTPSKETKRFVCHYDWDDARWGLEIHAYDWDDAEARCRALGRLRLDGEHVASASLPDAPLRWAGRLIRLLTGR
jgi:hypothetical protein